MNRWIHFFGAPDPRLDLAGGKGMNLSRLWQARMPVPPGFVVTTSAYRAFVDAHNLEPRIEALHGSASLDNPVSLDAAANSIRRLFVETTLDGEILREIEQAYGELCRMAGRTVEVAVRS